MNRRNYQKELDKVIEGLTNRPSLLLHSCCAPCSSYVLTYLMQYFDITVLYYNPNIYPPEEWDKRAAEQKRLIDALNRKASNERADRGTEDAPDVQAGMIRFICGEYDPRIFYDMAEGLEDVPEGGERCFKCYELRMREAAEYARDGGYDYFTTTLSISPLKNAEKINEIGEKLSVEYGVKHLSSDFKKRNGYKISCELSKEYDLYRQDYCGCVYSRQERERQKRQEMTPEKRI